jgi:phenylalanyl-tRNA synthetase beta chain
MKGDLEMLPGLSSANGPVTFAAAVHPALQPGQTAQVFRDGKALGWVGALHPSITQALDIPGKVLLAELDYALLAVSNIPVVTEVSRFPAVSRDLALVLKEDIQAADVLAVLREVAGEALQEVGIFDLYQGQNIETGKKSLALGLTFQHPSRTLADSEINPIINNCINALQAKFNAELR